MTLNEMNEANGFELGAALESGSKDSKVECGSPVVETGGDDANECVNMELSETDGFVLGADLEIGSKDSNVKSGSPVVETGGVDANECVNTTLDETDGFVIGADLESGIKDSSVKCGSPFVETAETLNANSVNDGRTEEKIREDDQVQGQDAVQLESPRTVGEKVSGGEHKASQSSLARERRKSKYLSPPFVDLSKGSKALPSAAEAEAESLDKPGNKSNEAGKSSSLVKRGRKRQSSKPLTASFGQVPTTAPSAELLMQLRVMALAPYLSIAVHPASVLFTQFRASRFSGISDPELIGEADTQDEQPFNDEENANMNVSSAPVQKPKKTSVRKMKKEKRMTGSVNVNVSSSSPSPLTPVAPGPSTSNTKPQRKRKRKDTTVPAPPAPNQAAAIPDLNGNNGNNGEPAKRKRMRKKKGTNDDTTTTMPGITHTNGETLEPISLEVRLKIEPSLPEPSDTTNTIPPAPVPHPNTSTPPKPIQPAVTKTPEKPAEAPISSTPEKPSADPSLDQMKRSLEFMTSMLEKSGNLISPEMRANLEKEIQNLLKKLNPMVGPSS